MPPIAPPPPSTFACRGRATRSCSPCPRPAGPARAVSPTTASSRSGTRNRFVFAVPRPDGTVQVGLTDDVVETIEDEPPVTDADERFLLETLSSGLSRPVTGADVVGRFAGLRPLLGQAHGTTGADLS